MNKEEFKLLYKEDTYSRTPLYIEHCNICILS